MPSMNGRTTYRGNFFKKQKKAVIPVIPNSTIQSILCTTVRLLRVGFAPRRIRFGRDSPLAFLRFPSNIHSSFGQHSLSFPLRANLVSIKLTRFRLKRNCF